MKKLWQFLFILFFFLGKMTLVSGQEKLIDSLQRITTDKNISIADRAQAQSKLAEIYSYQDSVLAQRESLKAIQMAQKSKDTDALVFVWSNQLTISQRRGNGSNVKQAIDSTSSYFSKASALYRGIGNYKIGHVQNIRGDYNEAITNFQKALDELEQAEEKNKKESSLYQAGIYNEFYGIYAEREAQDKAEKYAELTLAKALKSGDPSTTLIAWQIRGTRYQDQFYQTRDSVYIDSSLTAFQNAIAIYKTQKENLKSRDFASLPTIYLADTYLEFYPPTYKDSVAKYINLALQTSDNAINIDNKANAYNLLGKFNAYYGNIPAAKEALLKEHDLLKELNPPNYYLNKNMYHHLAKFEEEEGHFEDALKYYKIYMAAYREVYDKEQTKTIRELEAKYQNEKKDKELQLAQQKNAFQKQRNTFYMIISVVIIIGLVALFMVYRLKYKNAKQREALKTNEAKRLQAEQRLSEKEKEQLQKELMAGALQIEHKNEVLADLKEKLNQLAHPNSKQKLLKLINEEMKSDVDFERMKSNLKEVNPRFYEELQKSTSTKLTDLDLKYCTYFYMKLSTKEIATMMNVTPKSVRMAKYRLKKKLALEKGKDVETFLDKILL